MSEKLFERYLKNDLDDAGARELIAILATEQGAREFAEFVQEWTLLGAAARQRVADAERQSSRKLRKVRLAPQPAPSQAWIGWATGLAAAVLLMVVLASPVRVPPREEQAPVARLEIPEPQPPSEPQPAPELVKRPPPPPEPELVAPPPPSPRVEAPVEPEPPPPVVPPPKEKLPETRPAEPVKIVRPAMALIGRVQGEVRVISPEGKRKAVAGEGVAADEGVETIGSGSLALLETPDGSRIELSGDAAIERLVEKQGRRSVALLRGSLTATVTKQPAGRAMIIATPQAEVTVLGTQFTVTAAADSARLEVREGRVLFKRLPDGAAIEVSAGHAAVAMKGLKLESKPLLLTREFQDGPGYSGTRDTAISGADPGRSFGSEAVLEVDGDEVEGKKIYGLLKWDLSELPPNAVVKSAVITLHVSDDSQGSGYTFYEMKRAWSEADATWRLAAPGQPWRVAGARSSADRGAEPLGSVAPRSMGEVKILLSRAAEAAIQSWIRQPAANHGFIIANDGNADGFSFFARESAAVERRPKLSITYTLPAK